jgi:hypothetical protein
LELAYGVPILGGLQMKNFMTAIFTLCAVMFLMLPKASAEVPVPDDIYKWVQSSSRANYYFNMAQMCFDVDKDGMMDQNVLIVPIVKTYDALQIKDIQDKRLWREQDMSGYDDLAGVAEYLRIDLAQRTVTETQVVDLDSTGSSLETRYPNRVWLLDKLSEKNLERIFYETIIDYGAKHKDELIARSKGKIKPSDMKKVEKNAKKHKK